MKTLVDVLATVDRADVFFGVKVDSVTTKRFDGETALHMCAKWGDAEGIKVLVANGAEIDTPGEDNNTPLHYAAMLGQLSAVKALIDLGAANTRDRYGNLPVDLASDHPQVVTLLTSSGYVA